MKKITVHSEFIYVFALVLMGFAVAMCTAADYGVSMIVAPAYIIHLKTGFISFGQGEYIIQGFLFILFCIIMKRFRFVYFGSFITCLIYGFVLDLWRKYIPVFNPGIYPSGSFSTPVRVTFFIVSMVLTSLSVALFFKTYLHPEVYDMFVKGITERYSINMSKFKTCFDASFLLVSVAASLILFHGIKGIGIGTAVICLCNGTLIGLFSKLFDKCFNVKPLFPKLEKICRY